MREVEAVMRIRHGLTLDKPNDFDLVTQAIKPDAETVALAGSTNSSGVAEIGSAVRKLEANLKALIEALNKAKPQGLKGVYLRKISLSSTMGAGVRVDQASLQTQAPQ